MKHRKTVRHMFVGLPILLAVLAVGSVLLVPQPAVAANTDLCIQDNWAAHGNTQDLTCTANDVSVANVTNICVPDPNQTSGFCCQKDGCQPTCIQGQDVTFTATFEVLLTAQDRYDIGLYFGSANSTVNSRNVLTGTCNDFIITLGEETCATPPCNAGNTTNFVQLDTISQPTDTCGDISNNTKTTTLNNPQELNLTVTTSCQGDANGKLKLPNCTSWRTSGQNGICTGTADAYPGAPSKCNCQPGFTIDILTLLPSIACTKAASPTQVQEGPTGGTVTYTVEVTNDSTCSPTPCTPGSVSFTGLNDNKYGNIATVHSASGSILAVSGTTCGVATSSPGLGTLSASFGAGIFPTTIASGGNYTCQFQATVSGLDAGQSLSDTVNTTGATNAGTGGLITNASCSASVSATDVKPTAAVVKTAAFVGVICAEVGYTVQVDNTDTAESLTLTALTDDKVGGTGDITSVHDNILGTTCGVATGSNGLGDLSSISGAGVLPATIAIGSDYVCQFTAKVCSFPQTDTVTATLNDDENTAITKTGSIKVNSVGSCTLSSSAP
jgi:hypothetical protein